MKPNIIKPNILPFISLILLILLTACTSSSKIDGLVPAKGTVNFNGTPADGALVVFSPQDTTKQSRSASATTDAQGRFTMMTLNPDDGVFPGTYCVSVEKTETSGEYDETRDANGKIKITDTRKIADLLPEKYRDTATSGLSVVIPANGDRKIELNLTGNADTTPKHPDKRAKK